MTNAPAVAAGSVPLKHPPGLWVLFITEMWERFSYYGMRALLVLYLVQSTAPMVDGKQNWNPGFGWSEESAYYLYGIYTWLAYLTPLVGGWIADRFLGTHRSMVLGGSIIALGHITLALTESFGITPGAAVSMQTGPGALLCFMSGLALIIIGTGFFKPCVSVMVGQLYEKDDPRKDSGFTWFYMGINLGAFFSPLVAGTLGESVGWHWGFGSAAVGMVLGLAFYMHYRPKYLGHIGDRPIPTAKAAVMEPAAVMTSADWQRLGVIVILSFTGSLLFWMAFEQAGSSLTVFADEKTDRTLWGVLAPDSRIAMWFGWTTGFPVTWYQSVNPFTILVFGPLFAWLWVWLDRRKLNPPTPFKFAIALYVQGIAFLILVAGALEARDHGLAGPQWLFMSYIVATWGELCLSPVGLSMVTKLATPRTQSLMMGIWFASTSLSNLLSGVGAAWSVRYDKGEATFALPGLAGYFLLIVLALVLCGALLTVLAPVLKRMMHGVH